MNRSRGKGNFKAAGVGGGREMGFQPDGFWSFHTATSKVPAHSRRI